MWKRFKINEELKLVEMDEVVKAVTFGVSTISSAIRKAITIDDRDMVETNTFFIVPRFISLYLWKYNVLLVVKRLASVDIEILPFCCFSAGVRSISL